MPVETLEALDNWFKHQPQDLCVLVAVRTALRAIPIIMNDKQTTATLALASVRAILTSGVAAKNPTINFVAKDYIAASAANAAKYASKTIANVVLAAAFATYAAADPTNAASNAYSTVNAVINAADEAKMVKIDAYLEAAYIDTNIPIWDLINTSIWHGLAGKEIAWLVATLAGKDSLLDSGPEWTFWREWYQGFLDGNPLDWELQRRVALIDDPIWEAGPEAVAEEIARIRLECETEGDGHEPRRPEYEPQSVEKLFENKAVITASISQMSSEIAGAVGRFHSETGINQLPDPFVPLQAIPNSLSRINAVLKQQQPSTGTERRLREEIGRLNAKISRLERELEAASKSTEPIIAPAYKKQLATSLGDWKLYAALCAGLWVISGDQTGIQKRLENILSLRETLFGEDCPAPTEYPSGEPSIET